MSGLTPKQLEAISLLSSGFTQAETARQPNVSERTIHRWMKITAFLEALENTKRKATEKTVEATAENINAHVQKLLPKAIRTLEEILEDDEARNNDKLRASEILGRWGGLGQQQQQQQSPAEDNLKNYLVYLATNANSHSSANN